MTSALTVTIAGSTKQIALIVITGAFIEHTFNSALNIVGVCIFITALVAYAVMSYNKKLAAKTLPFPDFKAMGKAVVSAADDLAHKGSDLGKSLTEKTPLKEN